MAESRVKVPSQEAQGMDFLAFSFNGKHSWDDFHIYRTSDGDRYNENLTPTLTDKTAEVPGGDGMYYFGTTHKQKDFNISFAFDSLTEVQLKELKKWLNGKEMGDLWFQETPYKVWTAKPAGNSSIKYIPFDDENGQRVYKGEGTVQFTAYWPYAHTPDYVGSGTASGKDFDSYGSGTGAGAWGFRNRTEWKIASGLTSSTGACLGENPGDLPAPFIYTHPTSLGTTTSSSNTYYKIKIGNTSGSGATQTFTGAEVIIEIPAGKAYSELSWDSKTGIISAKVDSADMTTPADTATPIATIGNTCYAIPSDGVNTIQFLSVTKNGTGDFVEGSSPTNGDYKITISRDDDQKETGRKWQKYSTSWSDLTSNAPILKYHYWYY